MSTNATAGQESPATDRDCIDLDERDVRALTERMGVLSDDGDVYTVVGQHENGEYRVDVREGRCTCPDAKHRDPAGGCKHYRRVLLATGRRPIPAGVARDDVDAMLGEHLDDEGPRFAATDGGADVIAADADGDDDGRPDDCDCAPFLADADLPCWPCYRAGFEEPNPDATEGQADA